MAAAPSTWRLLRLHLALVVCICLCASAFVIEVMRALGGNTLSWAYVFEWPILLAYGVYLWHRLVQEEHAGQGRAASAPSAAPVIEDPVDEADRAAWNAYLAQLHAADAAAGRGSPGRPGPTPAS